MSARASGSDSTDRVSSSTDAVSIATSALIGWPAYLQFTHAIVDRSDQPLDAATRLVRVYRAQEATSDMPTGIQPQIGALSRLRTFQARGVGRGRSFADHRYCPGYSVSLQVSHSGIGKARLNVLGSCTSR